MIGPLSAIILGGFALYFLLRRKSNNSRIVPTIQEVLQNPEDIQVNLLEIHTPSLSGYSLKFLSYLYHTPIGRLLVSRAVLSKSNLDLFANCVIPEPPTLRYSPAPPRLETSVDNRGNLLSLIKGTPHNKLSNVGKLYAAYVSGKITPLDVARSALDAIEDSNARKAPLRAIVACNHASVLSMAEASTVRWKNGSQLSLLDGIPISIKEDMFTELYPFRCGATFTPELYTSLPESNVVRRLLDAGAIVIGIANMPEFGCNSIGNSENCIHEQPRNPHNTDFFPGGSSSGSAVSVAAGLCPISVASDGGGSGRVPAAVCGVFSLKLTQGQLDETGSYPSMFSFSVISPITSSPLDIALFLDVVCNYEGNTTISFDTFSNISSTLSGLTIGVYWDWIEVADKETVSVFCKGIEKMRSLGAVVKEIKIPELEEIRVAHIITTVGELSAVIKVDVDEHFHDIGPGTLLVSALGHHFSATDCINAMKQRTRTIKVMEAMFKEIDVIATPTVACPIPRISPEYYTKYGKIDGRAIGNVDAFTYLANFTGLPALTLPIGVLNEKLCLPVGLQLIAPWHQDPELIKWALVMEASGQFPQFKPKVWYDLLSQSP